MSDTPLAPDKARFAEFLVRSGALGFGSFTTAAGRPSPYFINSGRIASGALLAELAGFYARTLRGALGGAFEVLFGPAYKGIPLAAATAIELHRECGQDVAICFDRKEVKDHGEGGSLVGHAPRDGDRVVIVEDVVSAGGSVRRSAARLRAAAAVEIVGLVVSVDRMERGQGERSALEELRDELHVPTFPIVTIAEVMGHLEGRAVDGRVVLDAEAAGRVRDYLRQYGPRPAPW
jgi:orotate phosphoribosyltransferase